MTLDQLTNAIATVVDYNWEAEVQDYIEQTEGRDVHVFNAIVALHNFINDRDDTPASFLPLVFNDDGLMTCPTCGETDRPHLQEEGYHLNHHAHVFISKDGKLKQIEATGGTGTDFSENHGADYVLMCGSSACCATFPLPEDVEVEWQ